jgi:hypothetical protein
MDPITDNRERRKLEEQERERVRTLQYEELRSEFNSTAVRVRAWEKLHGLRLPANSNHPILWVISTATGLPVAALRDEQQARREARTARPATTLEVTNAPPEVSLGGGTKQQP